MNSINDFLSLYGEILLTAVSVLIAFFAAWVAYRQWTLDLRAKRIDYIKQTLSSILADPELKKAYDLLEYGNEWYSKDFHNGKNEYQIDKLLLEFNTICYYKQQGIVIDADFKLIKYLLIRIVSNEHIRAYLFNLYHFSKRVGCECSFQCLIDYARNMKIIDDDFFDKDSPNYARYKHLNF